MPGAHIYTLSRLVHAPAGRWESLIASIEDGKSFAFSYYLPMREAVARLCASRNPDREGIVRQMVARARASGGIRGSKVAKDNLAAFQVFEDVFLPQVAKFRRSFLHEKQTRCDFEGLALRGAPHFEVVDREGRKRYVFLHSSDWPSDDLSAYLELLGILVEKRYGSDPKTLWIMDLKKRKELRWRPSVRIRKRCSNAAKLYRRVISNG